MKLIRAFLVVLSVSSVDAARVLQLAETEDLVIEQVEEISQLSTDAHANGSKFYQSHGLPGGWHSSKTNPEGRGGWPTDGRTYYWKDGGDPQWSYPSAPAYDYYTGTYTYHYYSGSTTITTTTMPKCGFPQKEAKWFMYVVMKNPDWKGLPKYDKYRGYGKDEIVGRWVVQENVRVWDPDFRQSGWMMAIKEFVFHCFEQNSEMSSEFQSLLKDYGLLDELPTPQTQRYERYGRTYYAARQQQNSHRQLLRHSFKEELKVLARTGAKRQVENVDCSEVPGSEEKNGMCVCIEKGHVIKGFAPHCRVSNVRTFSAKDFLRCVCESKRHYVSGSCRDFGAPQKCTSCDKWGCETRCDSSVFRCPF